MSLIITNYTCTYIHTHTYSISKAGIQARRISGNLDSPEGGFDGFLQSIVCQDVSKYI